MTTYKILHTRENPDEAMVRMTHDQLKQIAIDRTAPPEDRFAAQLKLAELPRNSSPTRVRNRCSLTGRPRGYYRKFRLSRIALRELASSGQIPGMLKSSW